MVKVPTKTLERNAFAQGYRRVIGVDEVGMGCLAGPVVVCAVSFAPEFYRRPNRRLRRIRDSKLLVPHQRELFARELLADSTLRHAISVIRVREIDALNVFQAARAGMRRAIQKLSKSEIKNEKRKAIVLVDGPHRIGGISHDQIPIVKGDRKVFAIACASIIAKVHRDAMMTRYAKRYPGYGLEIHKGYATSLHRQRIADLGPCPLHRRSFRLTPRS